MKMVNLFNYFISTLWTFVMGYFLSGGEVLGNAKNSGDIMAPKCGSVFLTVSSLKGSFLELNWENKCLDEDEPPRVIGLYNGDIRSSPKEQIKTYVKIKTEDYPNGYYKTNVSFNVTKLPGNWDYESTKTPILGPHDLPYWIVSFGSQDKIIDIKSIKIQPSWMSDNREQLGNINIGNLLIPGTHDSACYRGNQNFIFEDYLLTQDFSIWDQLVFGIRYFDIRVGYYINQGFFINHDFMRIREIKPILQDFKRFIQASPNEILVIDFHRFPFPANWGHKLHTDFIEFLQKEIGEYAFVRNSSNEKGPKLSSVWEAKKNIIFTYAEPKYSQWHIWLWPPLQQIWADTTNQIKLKKHMEEFLSHKSQQITMYDALMVELTPKPLDVVLRKNNLRKLASEINSNVTKWVRDEWQNKVNIVASDFFLGNDIINVAIDINTKR